MAAQLAPIQGVIAPPQALNPTGPQGPAGPQGPNGNASAAIPVQTMPTFNPNGPQGPLGPQGPPPAAAVHPNAAQLLQAYAAFHQGQGPSPDPNAIGASAHNAAQINALFDTLAGHINDAYNAHVGNLNSEYGSGVAGVNQAGTQAHQQLGLYGQAENAATAAGNRAVTGDWNRVIQGGNQAVNDPMMSALRAYTGGRGSGGNPQQQYGNLAGYIGDLGASRAASQAFAQQLGQIAGVDNSNAQQVASGINQGGLTDLHSVLNSGLANAATARDTGLNNAALENAKLQIASNRGAAGGTNSLQNWLFKQQYTAAHPTPGTVRQIADLAAMKQGKAFTIPNSLFSPGASGSAAISGADATTLISLRDKLNSGANPQSVYNDYLNSSGGKYNPIIANLLQNDIAQHNNQTSIYG